MEKPFRLGLTMAGAVSAGAYTGGVLDYLFQTLDAWYELKNGTDPAIPKHNVSIDIISGASAGGITGAMAALAMHLEKRNHAIPLKRKDEEYLKENVFYNAWVNLTSDDMIPLLLDESDIDKDQKVVSLLNSEFIEKLAKNTIVCVPECTTSPPPYVSPQMELILTLSNLDGFTYELEFKGQGSSKHIMKQHRDYAFFRLGNDYQGDGRIPLNLQRENVGLQELLQAAPATGAFPVGLAYRKFVRKKKYILDNADLVFRKKDITTIVGIDENDPEGDYYSYNVDGGMLNNEPFDLTMKIMAKTSFEVDTAGNKELEKAEKWFDSSIIMIDPFPSGDSVDETGTSTLKKSGGRKKIIDEPFPYVLTQVMGKVLSSMRGELLFKGEDIVKAFTEEDFSRFMIAPRRRDKSENGNEICYNGSIGIACGALGGFSGFFDRSFRKHDFYLGRANCQSFLRKHFCVKLENNVPVNKLFADGYSKEAIERFKFQDKVERDALQKQNLKPDDAPWYVPIIPDVKINDLLYNEVPLEYPVYDMNRLYEHKEKILQRFKRVVKLSGNKWWMGVATSVAFFLFGNRIFQSLRKTISTEFMKWRLIK